MTEIELWASTTNNPFTKTTLEKLEDAVRCITLPEVQQFVVFGVMKCSTEEKLLDALDEFNMLKDFLTRRGEYNPLMPNKQNDCVFAAMLLHNIWYDQRVDDPDDDWIKVFVARQRMAKLAKEFIVLSPSCRDGVFDYIFQMIEAQLGEEMPVQDCRPMTGRMSYCMREIIWLYSTYLRGENDDKWKLEATSWK